MEFQPTEEQVAARDLFDSGDSMVIEAGAGTGKTSTLLVLADATKRPGQYLAFNKSIVTEAQAKFPANVAASTAHSLAFRALGHQFSHRLNGPRMKSREIAQRLGIDPFEVRYGQQFKRLADGYLAGLVMRAINRYCQSVAERPEPRHIPYVDGIDIPTDDGKRTYTNNDRLREQLRPALDKAWADLCKNDGQLPFKHEHYLKLYQLSNPVLPVDFVLFDEAQDANPVMAAIVGAQTHAQRVYVGDSMQAIYEFTGAVNALAEIPTDHRRFLTQSFRFGPAIATVANTLLELLGADLRLSGVGPASEIAELDNPTVMLCRTNAMAVSTLLAAKQRGQSVHLIGGGKEVLAFARAAGDLKAGRFVSHPELACFNSWGEVQEYVENDPQGDELKLLVDLIDKFGVELIVKALEHMPREEVADLVVSTAHKAKGREWDSVKLATDFRVGADVGLGELRLLYVAATRARLVLDETAVRKGLLAMALGGDPR